MATLYITEYSGTGYVNSNYGAFKVQVQAPQTPPVAQQTLAISGSPTASSPFQNNPGNTGAYTYIVRIHTDTICSIRFGSSPVATTTDQRLAANQTEYFTVVPGQQVSVILNV